MSATRSRHDVSGIAYHLGDDVLWDRDGYIWTGRIESTPSTHEDNMYTIMFAGADIAEVDDSDILGCAAGFWCDVCGGTMKQVESSEHDQGIVQEFECRECDGMGGRYFELDSNIEQRTGTLQPANGVLEGQPVDSIPERSQPGDGQ